MYFNVSMCRHSEQVLCFSKEYIGQGWCLFHRGQALPVQLPVVGSGVQPSATVISCHFLRFQKKLWPVSLPRCPSSLCFVFSSQPLVYLIKYHLSKNLLIHTRTFLNLSFLLYRLRVFDSGVMVVQLQSHSEEEMIASALDNVSFTSVHLY